MLLKYTPVVVLLLLNVISANRKYIELKVFYQQSTFYTANNNTLQNIFQVQLLIIFSQCDNSIYDGTGSVTTLYQMAQSVVPRTT